MKDYAYLPQKVKILRKKELSPETVSLRVKRPAGFSFHPGQFVLVGVLGFGEIPIGITTSPDEKEFIELGIRSAGMVSQKLCSLNEEDEVTINGPFGNGFPLSRLKGRDVVLVAGGIGLLPLHSLISHIRANQKLVTSLTVMVGAKHPDFLLYKNEYQDWEKFAKIYPVVDSCNESWGGCVGNLTKLYDITEVKHGSVMIVCGPPIMYPGIVSYYAGKRIAEEDLYFLLERRMKCGIGKCQHCTCDELYVCTDGPIFSYDKIKYNKEALLK